MVMSISRDAAAPSSIISLTQFPLKILSGPRIIRVGRACHWSLQPRLYQVAEFVDAPPTTRETQRHEHAPERAEPALAEILAIGEQEEFAGLVERATGLGVHEYL